MTYYPDLGAKTMIVSDVKIRAIGWLDDQHPYPMGDSSPDFIRALGQIVDRCREVEDMLYSDPIQAMLSHYFGFHTCELCHDFHHGGNIVVPDLTVLYVAPAMLLHYVEQHYYAPPKPFVQAVLQAPDVDTIEYRNAVARLFQFNSSFSYE